MACDLQTQETYVKNAVSTINCHCNLTTSSSQGLDDPSGYLVLNKKVTDETNMRKLDLGW